MSSPRFSPVLFPLSATRAGCAGQLTTRAALRRFPGLALVCALAVLSAAPAVFAESATAAKLVPASNPGFRYEGRVDRKEPASPVLIWQATRVAIDFEGPQLTFVFDQPRGQNYFDARVDDAVQVLEVNEGGRTTIPFTHDLSPGRHHLELFKRSEANAGTVHFRGIEVGLRKTVWPAPEPKYPWAFEFFGDSITVGACNEDGASDQWETRRTHNNALSWATMTAEAFHADLRNIAVSGMGITMGYVPVLAGQVWDRLYPSENSPRADLKAWKPDVAFVNFGENDTSFSKRQGLPFPSHFTEGYVALVKGIRQAYPEAHIVLLRGGMGGGAQDLHLRAAWDAAVTQLEKSDSAISHFVFEHWSPMHPRVADDRAMADELIAWLRAQPFMERGRTKG